MVVADLQQDIAIDVVKWGRGRTKISVNSALFNHVGNRSEHESDECECYEECRINAGDAINQIFSRIASDSGSGNEVTRNTKECNNCPASEVLP